MQKQPYLSIVRNAYKRPNKQDPDLRGYITLHEPLPAGKYEACLYEGTSEKGNKKYSGIIKVQLERVVAHWQDENK